ncbi:MAG: His/Gly/Thr/Pro-type tRNA ligase C-terminal domain-containing protein, partial [Candidatus Brocadiia bacterium]
NQWCNVVRWEMRTRLFLRTTEFLWQEGHTAHSTEQEAREEVMRILEIYRRFAEDILAMPVLVGRKTDSEKFAGAVETYSIEGLMQDGKALQSGTSHYLGQNFAKAFNVTFLDESGERKLVYATSWGVSTRLVGAVIMVHGDDVGVVFPPRIAPTQVVVVPIWKGDDEMAQLRPVAHKISEILTGVRVKVDARDNMRPGAKFYEWEKRGVPLRLEIGPKDLAKNQVVAVMRHSKEKVFLPMDAISKEVPLLLERIQREMYSRALKFREDHTSTAETFEEMSAILDGKGGFVRARWCGSQTCEAVLKEKSKATIRNIEVNQTEDPGNCVCCGGAAKYRYHIAKAY